MVLWIIVLFCVALAPELIVYDPAVITNEIIFWRYYHSKTTENYTRYDIILAILSKHYCSCWYFAQSLWLLWTLHVWAVAVGILANQVRRSTTSWTRATATTWGRWRMRTSSWRPSPPWPWVIFSDISWADYYLYAPPSACMGSKAVFSVHYHDNTWLL